MHVVVAAAQYPIRAHASWQDWQAHLGTWVREATRQGATLLVFPEYGAMELVSLLRPELQADLRGQVRALDALRDDFCAEFSAQARRAGVTIVAPSLPVLVSDRVLNRVYVFAPNGDVGYQDKWFMTRFENEEWGIHSAPRRLAVFEADWGRFGVQICYDVEFSVGARELAAAGAHLILAPSCTETPRGAARVHLGARARALENQAYTVVAQTVGTAPWSPAVDINYGYAGFYATPDRGFPEDGILHTGTAQRPGWVVQTLDLSALEIVRREGQVLNFRDHQPLQTHWGGETAYVERVLV
jgi:predicted amidohydrolase